MDSDTQALFKGYYNKGFPAEGVSKLKAVRAGNRKGCWFPGNTSLLWLLS